MSTFKVGVDVNRPADVVFSVASDIENFSRRTTSIKSLEIISETRSGLGTRWRETRTMFGRDATETMEIVEWQPPRSYTVGGESCGCLYRTVVRVTATATGSRIDVELTNTPITLFARIVSTVMTPIMRKMCCKLLLADFEAVKKHCESQPA